MTLFVTHIDGLIEIKALAAGDGIIGDMVRTVEPGQSVMGKTYDGWTELSPGKHDVAVGDDPTYLNMINDDILVDEHGNEIPQRPAEAEELGEMPTRGKVEHADFSDDDLAAADEAWAEIRNGQAG